MPKRWEYLFRQTRLNPINPLNTFIMLKIQEIEKGILFWVRLQPGVSHEEIVGIQGDMLKIKVCSPPVRGAANQALISLIAKHLRVKKSQIEIAKGQRARKKMIKITGPPKDLINQLRKIG